MRYLVTGTGGFIGKYICKELERRAKPGDVIVGIDRNADYTYSCHPQSQFSCKNDVIYSLKCQCELHNRQWVERLLAEYKPDVIYHLAGCATVSSPARRIWESNVDTTFNLIDCIPKDHRVRFILASSIMAKFVQSPYAASKAAAENLIEAYNNYNDYFIGTSVRFCAVAGAYNTHGAVRDIVRKVIQERRVSLLSNSKKPYIYINNLVDAILSLENIGSRHILNPTINICPIGNISIREIAEIVMNLTNQNKEIEFIGKSWMGDMDDVVVSPDNNYNKLSNVKIPSSREAVELAVKDILRLEYGVNI